MKSKIIISVVAVIIGLTLGYVVFGGVKQESKVETQEDQIWTCSMHPQIRKSEPGDCPICGMDLIPLDGNTNSDPMVFEMTPEAIKISNIQTTIIGSGSIGHRELVLSGKIKADETTASSVVTHIPGRIEKLFVSFTGEQIRKGQKVALIYSPNLITAQRELLEAFKVKESSPKLLEATKNKLRYWKITESQINKIISSNKILENFPIYADHTGIVSKRKVSVGDHLMQGGVLFEIQNLNKLWAVFDVYEQDLSNVQLGNEISFTTPSIPSEEFKSKVTFIDPTINSSTRTAAVRLELVNSGNKLKPDMFISGKLQTTHDPKSGSQLMVPKSAVLWTGERSVVYVKLPEMDVPSFEFREVELGTSMGNSYIVIDGIYAGDEVVTNGAFVIDASAQLNNQASMMNRNLLSSGTDNMKTPDFSNSTDSEFKKQLDVAVKHYLDVKNALVKTNASMTSSHAKEMLQAVKNVDMLLVKGQSHMYWMKHYKVISESLIEISSSKNVENQRNAFDDLSNSIIKVSKAFGLYDGGYVVQFCPMALKKEGAFWLSDNSKIRNPYFGDEMLECGELKDTIKKSKIVMQNSSTPKVHNH